MPRINNSNSIDVKTLTLLGGIMLLVACGGGGTPAGPPGATTPPTGSGTAEEENSTAHADLFTAADLNLGDIDPALAEKGRSPTM
ncbi:MAG: hypothetical protein IPG74_10935 [Flavobacteriales bacterium]|nr:hypothetical protein [Flavobacteriales bacterium]